MKKLFVIIFCFLLLSTGCSSGNSTNSETQTTTFSSNQVKDTTLTLTFEFGTRTGTYSGGVNSFGIPNGKGTFTSKNGEDSSWTYNGDWVNGHWNGNGTSEWSSGESYSGEYKDDYATGHGIYTFKDGRKYEGEFACGVLCGDAVLYYPDGSYFKGDFSTFSCAKGIYYDTDGYEYEAEISDNKLTKRSLHDFFDDKERQNKFTELYESYKYTELKKYVDKYIKDNSPSPLDSAYSILEMIEPLIKYEDNWILTHDDFDGTDELTFENVDGISESKCVYARVIGDSGTVTFGFVKNDWLFFDRIRISANGKVIFDDSFKSYDIQRDVVSGSIIKESVGCSFSVDEANEIIKEKTVKIRFENSKKDEYYEKELNKDDIEAIYCTTYLKKNNRDLSNLLFEYNHRD